MQYTLEEHILCVDGWTGSLLIDWLIDHQEERCRAIK